MTKGDISNKVGPLMAFDFDSLLESMATIRQFIWIKRMERWPWIQRRLAPYVLRRFYRVMEEPVMAAYWMVTELNARIAIIVRRQYTPGVQSAVEKLLADVDFPHNRIHLVPETDLGDQALNITKFCRATMAYRFFTRDEGLTLSMSFTLVKLVDDWLNMRGLIEK